MEALLRAVEQVRERIDKHRAELQKSEALTRYVLIDPILRALGWDTEDPEQVRPEFPTETGKPDYALIWERDPQIMIEAKSLERDLEEARKKGFEYCWRNKYRYYVVTDGDIWEIWDLKEIGGIQLTSLQISRDGLGEAARKLFALWRPALPHIEATPQPLVKPPSPPPPGITLRELKAKVKYKDKPPQLVIFPDGRKEDIKRWHGLLVAVAGWVAPKLRKSQIPIRTGPKNYLLNFEPVHSTGRRFGLPKKVSNLWLETGFSAPDSVRFSCLLLETVGVSPDQVRVEF